MKPVSKGFPYTRLVNYMIIGSLVTAGACLAYGMIMMWIQNTTMARPILVGVLMTGISVALIGLGTPGPSIAHYRRTGRYLVPAKGSPFETRWAWVMWLFTVVFASLGIALVALGAYAMIIL